MNKKNLKRSLVLGALMAFVITGQVWAAAVENNASTGCSAIAIGSGAIAKDNVASDSAVAIGALSTATGKESVAIGRQSVADGQESVAVGNVAKATGFEAIAVGYNSNAAGSTSIAIGAGKNVATVAQGTHSVAIGYDAKSGSASGANGTVAIGQSASATSDGAVAIGRLSSASANSSVAFGASSKASGVRSVAVGYQAIASGLGDVAIGVNSATKDVVNTMSETIGGVTYNFAGNQNDGILSAASIGGVTDSSTMGASKANPKTIYRQLQNVAAGQVNAESTDAVNGSQLFAAYQAIDANQASTNAAVTGINQRLDRTNAKINKVGAGAAALAALHPLEYDPEDKLTFSAGMGNYAGENAAALGAFYRPNEKFMVSLGGTMGNGENMVNLGISVGLDKPNGFAKMSKRELIQKVNSMEAEMAELRALVIKLAAEKK